MTILTYSLIVTEAPEEGQSSRHAYQFAQALLAQGHTLVSVFFYHAGVNNSTAYAVPPNDEFNLTQAWQELATRHNVLLETCVSASLRRGIIDATQAKQHQMSGTNIADNFHLSGLGSLSTALLEQDRVVQF